MDTNTKKKLLLEFACSKDSLETLSNKYNMDKVELVKLVRFDIQHKRSMSEKKLRKQLNYKLVMEFYNSYLSSDRFSEKYGYEHRAFLRIIEKIVSDSILVPSDKLASEIYAKAMDGSRPLIKNFPERIILMMGNEFVYGKFKLEDLACKYNINRSTAGKILKRGIAEDIVSDEVADKIYARIAATVYTNVDKTLESYEKAFEQREITKLKKSRDAIKAQLESDDDSLNYSSLYASLQKIEAKLEKLDA